MKTITVIIFLFLLSSCAFKRKIQKSENRTDSVKVLSIDSVTLKRVLEQSQYSNTNTKESFGFTTATLNPKYDSLFNLIINSRDTNGIINFRKELERIRLATPISNFYYTKESGNATGSQSTITVDSNAYKLFDSIRSEMKSNYKNAITKAGIAWPIYVLAGAFLLLVVYVYFAKRKKIL